MLKKITKHITELYAVTTIIFIVVKAISDKDAVFNFLTAFKLPWLFYIFSSLVLILLILSRVENKDEPKKIGLNIGYSDENAKRTAHKRSFLKIATYVVVISATISFLILLFAQFQREEFGIVAGGFGKDTFNKALSDDVRNGLSNNVTTGKPPKFKFENNSKIEFGTDSIKTSKLFKQSFKNGLIYSGCYDDTQDSLIFLSLTWVGADSCTGKNDINFKRQISHCTVGIVEDASLISSFILSFIYLHTGNNERSKYYADIALQQIDSVKNTNILSKLEPLQNKLKEINNINVVTIKKYVVIKTYEKIPKKNDTPQQNTPNYDTTNYVFGSNSKNEHRNTRIELDKMNVLYIGVDNPIEISAYGYAKDQIYPRISSEDMNADYPSEIKGRNGQYVVTVKQRGTIKISILTKSGNKLLGVWEYRVKPLPPPHVKFCNKAGGGLSVIALKSQNRIFALLDDFDFDVRFTINHFTMFINKPRSDLMKFESNSNLLTPEMQFAMGGLIPGTTITIKFVFVTGPDGLKRSLDPIIFTAE